MTQENKELLLKDLCNRIMYGVKCTVYEDTNVHTLSGVLPGNVYNELYFEELNWKECNGFADVQYCKPYLFPLSSMTEEQKKEMKSFDPFVNDEVKTLGDWAVRLANFYNKYHFDYNGLIPKGFAKDATGLNIY